jgi:tripartite motif-containing protein 56
VTVLKANTKLFKAETLGLAVIDGRSLKMQVYRKYFSKIFLVFSHNAILIAVTEFQFLSSLYRQQQNAARQSELRQSNMATAPDTPLARQLEELLRCSICHETLTERQTLGCFHSFCRGCLAQHVENQRREAEVDHEHQHSCPVCRTQFQLNEGESTKSSFVINSLLEILSIQNDSTHLYCDHKSCAGRRVAASCKCVDCEKYLCEECLKQHSEWPSNSWHCVFTLEELRRPENRSKLKPKQKCEKDGHENKPLEYYCGSCEELACVTCVLSDHPQPEHSCKPTSVVGKQQQEDLKETSADLEKKVKQGQSSLQKIKSASQNLEAHNKIAKAAILKHEKEILDEFTKRLKHHTAKLIVESDRTHNTVNRTLVEQYDGMEAHVAKLNGLMGFVNYLVEEGSNEDIVLLRNCIKSNANDVEMKCPKLMAPVHYGRFKYVQLKTTQQIFGELDLNDLGEIGKFD